MEKTTTVLLWRGLVLAGVIVAACHPAHAQSVVGAQISGVVTDQTGAVIPNAQIKATQAESGETRTTVSSSTGSYVLPNLPVGPYRLEVTNQGFERYVQSGIILTVGNEVHVNVNLKRWRHNPGGAGIGGRRHGADPGHLRLGGRRPTAYHRSSA